MVHNPTPNLSGENVSQSRSSPSTQLSGAEAPLNFEKAAPPVKGAKKLSHIRASAPQSMLWGAEAESENCLDCTANITKKFFLALRAAI